MKTLKHNKNNRLILKLFFLRIYRKIGCIHARKTKFVGLTTSRLLCIFPFFFVASCGVTTTNTGGFSQKAQSSIQKGMTKTQVRSQLGNPVSVTNINNTERWTYTKINPFNPFVTDHQIVTVSFSQNGRVTSVDTVGHRASAGAVYGL